MCHHSYAAIDALCLVQVFDYLISLPHERILNPNFHTKHSEKYSKQILKECPRRTAGHEDRESAWRSQLAEDRTREVKDEAEQEKQNQDEETEQEHNGEDEQRQRRVLHHDGDKARKPIMETPSYERGAAQHLSCEFLSASNEKIQSQRDIGEAEVTTKVQKCDQGNAEKAKSAWWSHMLHDIDVQSHGGCSHSLGPGQ